MNKIRRFFQLESASGILLIGAAVFAMIMVNSPLANLYEDFKAIPIAAQVGALEIDKPLILWVSDGLMAIFFLLIGLEVKREMLEGQLFDRSQLLFPSLAAVGGMLMPAVCFIIFNYQDSVALHGWAIPAATDIAFALGVLSLLGKNVPPSLKLFLLTLAIMDDIGAIIIIAIFYTVDLSVTSIILACAAIVILTIMNIFGVYKTGLYIFVGVFMWICVLKSGVHATLAGFALAMAIPLRTPDVHMSSPLRNLEHALQPWVAFLILPIFSFVNAGVSLSGMTFSDVVAPVPLGIIAGLFIGKQLGIFSFCWLAIKLGIAKLPPGSTWVQLYGVSILCGIGFTMSLFINSLAFENAAKEYAEMSRLAILLGSLLSAIVGYIILHFSFRKKALNTQVESH